MAPNRENMAPGQQNYPKNSKHEDEKLVHPDEEITKGSQQADQLERLKPNAQNTSGQDESTMEKPEDGQAEDFSPKP